MVLVGMRGYDIFEHAVGDVCIEIRFYYGYAARFAAGVDEYVVVARFNVNAIARITVAQFEKMYRKIAVGNLLDGAVVENLRRLRAVAAGIGRAVALYKRPDVSESFGGSFTPRKPTVQRRGGKRYYKRCGYDRNRA